MILPSTYRCVERVSERLCVDGVVKVCLGEGSVVEEDLMMGSRRGAPALLAEIVRYEERRGEMPNLEEVFRARSRPPSPPVNTHNTYPVFLRFSPVRDRRSPTLDDRRSSWENLSESTLRSDSALEIQFLTLKDVCGQQPYPFDQSPGYDTKATASLPPWFSSNIDIDNIDPDMLPCYVPGSLLLRRHATEHLMYV